ncbi:hypothetical protein GY14_08185 [Delftia tsuruhatensis]|nr:hypothetical protein GY14_08185 [Delftia tsuruhatensis]
MLRHGRDKDRLRRELDRARLETREISARQSLSTGISELGAKAWSHRHRFADLVKAATPLRRPDAAHSLRAWHPWLGSRSAWHYGQWDYLGDDWRRSYGRCQRHRRQALRTHKTGSGHQGAAEDAGTGHCPLPSS